MILLLQWQNVEGKSIVFLQIVGIRFTHVLRSVHKVVYSPQTAFSHICTTSCHMDSPLTSTRSWTTQLSVDGRFFLYECVLDSTGTFCWISQQGTSLFTLISKNLFRLVVLPWTSFILTSIGKFGENDLNIDQHLYGKPLLISNVPIWTKVSFSVMCVSIRSSCCFFVLFVCNNSRVDSM
jgi:hypothetical protein